MAEQKLLKASPTIIPGPVLSTHAHSLLTKREMKEGARDSAEGRAPEGDEAGAGPAKHPAHEPDNSPRGNADVQRRGSPGTYPPQPLGNPVCHQCAQGVAAVL